MLKRCVKYLLDIVKAILKRLWAGSLATRRNQSSTLGANVREVKHRARLTEEVRLTQNLYCVSPALDAVTD
jgi:hypothetical protein